MSLTDSQRLSFCQLLSAVQKLLSQCKLFCSLKFSPFLPSHPTSIHLHGIIMRLQKLRVGQEVRWLRGDREARHCRIWSTLIFQLLEGAWLSVDYLTGALKLQKPACATHFKTYNNVVKCKLPSLSLDFPLLMSKRKSNTFVLLCADQTAKMKWIGLETLFYYFLLLGATAARHTQINTPCHTVTLMTHHTGRQAGREDNSVPACWSTHSFIF